MLLACMYMNDTIVVFFWKPKVMSVVGQWVSHVSVHVSAYWAVLATGSPGPCNIRASHTRPCNLGLDKGV